MSLPRWDSLKNRLYQDYPQSVVLVRDKMKRVLGFTPREHAYFDRDDAEFYEEVHLDFYDEQKRTMFLLKYSEFLNETHR